MSAVTHADATDEQRAKRLALDACDGDPDAADCLLEEARHHAERLIGAQIGRTRRLAAALLRDRHLDAEAVAAALTTQEAQ
jgi:hypothetical protein